MHAIHRYTYVLFINVMAILLSPALLFAEKQLSDEEKKNVVYEMYGEYKKEFPNVQDISVQEAEAHLLNNNIVFVDTREQAEISVSRLPASITKEEFLAEPQRYKDKIAVGYCTISYRSGLLAKELAARGIRLYNLQGGILAWTLEGGKIYDEQGETKRIHVYGKKWSFAPQAYDAVMFGFWEKLF